MPESDETLSDLASADAAQIEEYKLLQGKLDKIGEFRFHVKNWAFTLTLAILAGGITARAFPWGVFAAGVIPAAAFWGLERRQHRLADVFGKRAVFLEGAAEANAAARTARLQALGRPIPSLAPIRIAQAIGEAQPGGKLPIWKNADYWAYLSMVFLAGLGAFAAHLRGSEQTQQIGGKVSVDLLSSTAQLPTLCNSEPQPTTTIPNADTAGNPPSMYDAYGNKLP